MIQFEMQNISGRIAFRSFAKLYKYLELTETENQAAKMLTIKKSYQDMVSIAYEKLEDVKKDIIQKSIGLMCDLDVKVQDLYMGKERNCWEAVFDVEGETLKTESIEWPMELPPKSFYIFCLFRYITGVNTSIVPRIEWEDSI